MRIPTGMANADWDISLLNSAGDVIARRRVAGSEDPNALWDEISRPAVGTFTLRIRGPWGRGASRNFTIVEGLSVQPDFCHARQLCTQLMASNYRVNSSNSASVTASSD
jgi:hypothetical protein